MGGPFFLSSRRARSPRSPWPSAASLGVLFPAITPDRYTWFPQADLCIRALGCTDPRGGDPAWAHAAAARGARDGVAAHVGESARRARRKARADDAHDREDRRARDSDHPRLHDRPQQHGRRREFRRGIRGWARDVTGAFVLAVGAAMVGSLFSSDAWNNVTFAAAEVQNPRQESSAGAGVRNGARERALRARERLVSAGAADARRRGWRDGARARDRARDAGSRRHGGRRSRCSAPGGATIMAIAILVSTFGCNNGLILAGARVYFAMARDRLFFRRAARSTRRRFRRSR